MKKKLFAMLLVLSMLLALVPAVAQAAGSYTDTAGNWAESSIERWSEAGVVHGQGDGTFNPSGNMTRAEAAQTFTNLMKLSAKADISAFADVPADAWYADPIAKCAAAGIMNGTSATTADPAGELTREQMFVMVGRALGVEPAETCDKSFADADQVDSWAVGYINALVNMGVINGVDDSHIAPVSDINRASVMAVMDRMIGTYANADGTWEVAENGVTLVVAENVKLTGKAGELPIILAGNTAKVDMSKVTGAANVMVETNKVDITGAPAGTEIKSDSAADVTANGKDVNTTDYTVGSISSSGGSSSGGGTSSRSRVDLDLVLENLESDPESGKVYKNEALTITLSVPADKADAYELPDTVAVTVDGEAVEGVYDAATGKITLTAAQVTGDIVVTASAKAKEVAPVAADVVAAPLSADANATGYTVTGTVAADGTVNVTIAATSLTEHANGAETVGYWVGFGMPVEGDASAYTYTVAEGTGEAEAVTGPQTRTITENDKTYATIYLTADVTSYTVTQTKGEETVTYKVTINVTTKVPAEGEPETTYALTGVATPENSGTVTFTVGGAAATTAKKNDTVTVVATPETGYKLTGVAAVQTGTDTAVTIGADNTFTMPAAAVTVTATFEKEEETIQVTCFSTLGAFKAPENPNEDPDTCYGEENQDGKILKVTVTLPKDTTYADAKEKLLTPVWEDWEFAGWSGTAYSPDILEDTAVLSDGMKLYAVWKQGDQTCYGGENGDIGTGDTKPTIQVVFYATLGEFKQPDSGVSTPDTCYGSENKDGKILMVTMTVAEGTELKDVQVPTPVWTGWNLSGWSGEAFSQNTLDENTVLTNGMKLFAVWNDGNGQTCYGGENGATGADGSTDPSHS